MRFQGSKLQLQCSRLLQTVAAMLVLNRLKQTLGHMRINFSLI
jgi:hypothetical protein